MKKVLSIILPPLKCVHEFIISIIWRDIEIELTLYSQVAGGPNSAASTLKAARAALMLIPILGIHFLLMPIR